MSEQPYIVNPEAVGDPDETPIVHIPADTVAAMKRLGMVCECGGMNGYHHPDCTAPGLAS